VNFSDLQAQARADDPLKFDVGSMVEVPMAQGLPRYGVIKWIGSLPTLKDKVVAGLELVRTTEYISSVRTWNHIYSIISVEAKSFSEKINYT